MTSQQFARVPNTYEGREFIKILKKNLKGGDFYLRLRGRKPDRTHPGYRRRGTDTPLYMAKEIAIYLKVKYNKSYVMLGPQVFSNIDHWSKMYYDVKEKFDLINEEKVNFINYCIDKAPELVLKYKMLKNGGKI